MQSTGRCIEDNVLAAIIALGLQCGVFSKRDAILWADREIELRAESPTWLTGLSLLNSRIPFSPDPIGEMEEIGRGADANDVCVGVYSLVPDLTQYAFDECHAVATQLYAITRSAFKEDFSCRLLYEAMYQCELFDGWSYGVYSREAVIAFLQEFLDSMRDRAFCDRLAPLKYVVTKNGEC